MYWRIDIIGKPNSAHFRSLILKEFFDRSRRQNPDGMLVDPKKNHPLLEALTEYNRLVKANYLLNYIDDVDIRNHVQRALNRGKPTTSYGARSAM